MSSASRWSSSRQLAGAAAALLAALLAAGCAGAAPGRPIRTYRDLDYGGLKERYAKIDGVTVCYVDEGAGEDVVVLLHPMASTLKVWRPTILALRDRHRVIAIDLPGHGKSAKPRTFRYHPETFARVVHRLLDHLRLQRVTLVGNSNGGATVLALALRHPERVRRLVLVDAAGARAFPQLQRDFVSSTFTARHLRTVVPWLLRLSVRVLMFVARNPYTEEYVEDFVRQRTAREFDDWARAQVRVVRAVMAWDASARLGQVRAPTLVVHGERDRAVPRDFAERLARAIPGARLVVLKGVGHMPEVEAPAAFNREVGAFLEATRWAR
ncbi:MAG: alpha/beta fold hydrolase [Deltaproteobacteria bacterium]|nr:alpha/beta fold hydrolase [Deltaproteobacteria bacterium]